MSEFSRCQYLDNVTLVAVSSVAMKQTVLAMHKSMREFQFSRSILFTDDTQASQLSSEIEIITIPKIRSKAEYSRFLISRLHEHIHTSHMLCVQWDGYVLRGQAWTPEFLEYDFIGSPWAQFSDGLDVGNGGFSLRSRRIMEISAKLYNAEMDAPEDVVICRYFRRELEDYWNIKFAPLQVARRFSYERHQSTGVELGFHGSFNLAKILDADEAIAVFGGLERNVMTQREELEILRWALLHGRMRLARTISRRLLLSY